MNSYFKPVVIVVLSMFLYPALSESACLNSAKIRPALCARLDSVQASDLVPVNITLYEPIFHIAVCEDRSIPPPDPRICGTIVDSTAAYWTLHRQEVLRIFSDCPVYDTSNLTHRLDSTNFRTTRNYTGLATRQTIAALAAESLVTMVDLGFYFRLPDATLQATVFPFDTTIIGLIRVTDSNRVVVKNSFGVGSGSFAPVSIHRYGLSFVLYRPFTLTICPLPLSGDFVLDKSDTSKIKYPRDQTQLYSAIDCCGGVPKCSSWVKIDTSILTHEYRFRTTTSFLYMKVLDGSKPDSIKLRFDTKSFLGATAIAVPSLHQGQIRSAFLRQHNATLMNARAGNALLHDVSVSVYSISGRKIGPAALMRSGVVVVKKMENGGVFYSRNVLAW